MRIDLPFQLQMKIPLTFQSDAWVVIDNFPTTKDADEYIGKYLSNMSYKKRIIYVRDVFERPEPNAEEQQREKERQRILPR